MKSSDRPPSGQTALITGAASGIGPELVREFARHHHPLVIVAPIAAELGELTKQLHADFGVPVTPIVADLTEPSAAEKIFQIVTGGGAEVDVLVNNTGPGQRGKFWEIPIDRDLATIRLNIEAIVRLTKLFVQPMVQRGYGRILNIAAVTGFEPRPMRAVRRATRAFVLSWSDAIAAELAGTGVTVTALGPESDADVEAGTSGGATLPHAGGVTPQAIARAAREATMRGGRISIPEGIDHARTSSHRLADAPAQ